MSAEGIATAFTRTKSDAGTVWENRWYSRESNMVNCHGDIDNEAGVKMGHERVL